MERVEIERFKGLADRVEIRLPEGRSLAVFGDNGSGKTSLFEAIRLWYFREELKRKEIEAMSVPESVDTEMEKWRRSFQCLCEDCLAPYTIVIDDTPLDFSAPTVRQVFMLGSVSGAPLDTVRLSGIISYKSVHGNNLPVVSDIADQIVDRVNATLAGHFMESFSISLLPEGNDYLIRFDSPANNLKESANLHEKFNEARIRIVRLLLFLEYAFMAAENCPEPQTQPPLLVLDDFITSLDASNRLCILKLLRDRAVGFQTILLTHNASFFNLIHYVMTGHTGTDGWVYGNLMTVGGRPRYYNFRHSDTVAEIEEFYNSHPTETGQTANRLRKRFEILVHEFCKLTHLETHSEMSLMLQRILKDDKIYLRIANNGEVLHADHLIDKIRQIADTNPDNAADAIKGIIGSYETPLLHDIKESILEAEMYQKVVMHQGSHGIAGHPTIPEGEILRTIRVLRELEEKILELNPGAVYLF